VNAEDLDNLLRRADDAAAVPQMSHDVAGRVRRRQARRRRVRAAVASSVVVLCLAAGVWQLGRPTHEAVATKSTGGTVVSVPPVDPAALRSELASLRRQSDRYEAVAARLLVSERRRGAAATERRRLAAAPAVIDLAWQREQAALVLVRQGDRLAGELNLPEPAAVAYRQASETFPDTHWAGIARERLTQSN
jgi:hypothetical protein